ncbi:MAG: methylmalonyl-CoA epimerase [Actinobacteria bacterium]|nr:methylmalonyl-CoA epimerase [Actinomycetota bacterium]MEA2535621.1 methylmalonyl-CoA/ethylmalonyl-CoA epimerase [Actinomycetota bacterium]MEA2567202.1 methylmalonyl-CoA/ethylmalonyl-CoA epimerase [Actinomycetota bacterium]MEA2589460.1 methylmalonyl-CoA/ethylmalonyl-CoA epimerase [Actinomycetota bacterium]MEA2591740.1 methylmalonyl-CoA/ethylmalonyl-CoA epimerase [Actinomycetota bacterium]
MLRRVDHVALAVSDLNASIEHYQRVWGLTLSHREVVAEQGVEEAMFRLGDTYLQLVAPLDADTPVGRFIQRRGEGLHHIAYEVDGIEAALATAREHDLVLIDEEPRRGSRNTRVAFVHPRTNHGVLVELVEIPHN